MAIASNGSFIVYSAAPENPGPQAKPQIFIRRLDQMNAAPVAGTEGGTGPFLSPDDRWIGFWAGGKLKKVPVPGGIPIVLCDAAFPFGADWGSDNKIIYSGNCDSGLSRISSEGGQPEILTTPEITREEGSHRLPHFLPKSRCVLFTFMGDWYDFQPRLALLDLQTRKWHELIKDAADGRYLPTGHLIFLRQGTLMAVDFDLGRLEVKGQPVPIVENVMQALRNGESDLDTTAGQYSVSDSGCLAYIPGGVQFKRKHSLMHVDQKGNAQLVVDCQGRYSFPRFSPDGRQFADSDRGGILIYDLIRGVASRLPTAGGIPTWTPDGSHLVFTWSKSHNRNLYWQLADGSSPVERLTMSEYDQYPGSFDPNGSTFAFMEVHSSTDNDILLLDMKSRRVTPFINSKASEGFPAISPDGRWMAYATDESGSYEVWVRPFPSGGGRWQISKEGGCSPIWSKDGRQLFYRMDDKFWAVDVRTEGEFSLGKPRLLFEKPGIMEGNPNRMWDLWPDGQGFLVVKPDESKSQPITEMILIQNWFEELKRLLPAK